MGLTTKGAGGFMSGIFLVVPRLKIYLLRYLVRMELQKNAVMLLPSDYNKWLVSQFHKIVFGFI